GAKGDKGDSGAKGDQGDTGKGDKIEIRDGYWYINGENTNILARGENGVGKSAYQLWVEEVNAGNITKDGTVWPTDRVSLGDFWAYLKGKDGENGIGGGTPYVETELKVLSFREKPMDAVGPIRYAEVNIKTEPDAKVFYQSSTSYKDDAPGDDDELAVEIYTETADNDGRCTIIVPVASKDHVVHIWAVAKNKMPSPQQHLGLGSIVFEEKNKVTPLEILVLVDAYDYRPNEEYKELLEELGLDDPEKLTFGKIALVVKSEKGSTINYRKVEVNIVSPVKTLYVSRDDGVCVVYLSRAEYVDVIWNVWATSPGKVHSPNQIIRLSEPPL
ncbi:MAG: hypothetical protein Q4A14_03930, partial [Porphyromonas sp.]|nr:hypothetical protein [Porphyromonas sp.]